MAESTLAKTAALLRELWFYTAPRGNWRVRGRIAAALAALWRQRVQTSLHR